MSKEDQVRICPIASGSKGNSVFVSCKNLSLLIDAGLSGVEIEKRLKATGISPESLDAIVVTHEHSDHVKGVGVLSRRYNIPVYMNRQTREAAPKIGRLAGLEWFQCGTPFMIDGLEIDPFTTSHDAADPAGLTLSYKSTKIGIATDMGAATGLVKQRLKHCALLYIESNHDPDMLIKGPYPWPLKQRIRGRQGHLSNEDAAALLKELAGKELKHVILAHLSEKNNTPEKALQAAQEVLTPFGVGIDVAMPHGPGTLITL